MVSRDALAVAARINKQLGREALTVASQLTRPPRYTSGSPSIDVALGGGWPAGTWCEVIGKESAGKTAICFKTIAANQAIDPDFQVLWVAAEHFDTDQAQRCGIDIDRIIVADTQDMEQAYELIIAYAESGTVDAIILDSYPALIPNEEAIKSMDDAVVALGARLTGRFFRRVGKGSGHRAKQRPLLGIIINQYRDKIGAWAAHGHIPQTSPGGNAKNYAYCVRLEVARDDYIDIPIPGKNTKQRVGQTIKCRAIKNKSAPPGRVATVDFYFADAPGLGMAAGQYDEAKDVAAMALLFNVITRAGAYYDIAGHRVRGRDQLIDLLRSDDVLRLQIALDTLAAASLTRPGLRDMVAGDVVADTDTVEIAA